MSDSTAVLYARIARAGGVTPARFALSGMREIEIPEIGTGSGWLAPVYTSHTTGTGRQCAAQHGVRLLACLRPRRAGDLPQCPLCGHTTASVLCLAVWCGHDAHALTIRTGGTCPSCTVSLWRTARRSGGMTVLDLTRTRNVRVHNAPGITRTVTWADLDLLEAPARADLEAARQVLLARERSYHSAQRSLETMTYQPAGDVRPARKRGQSRTSRVVERDRGRLALERCLRSSDPKGTLVSECASIWHLHETGQLDYDTASKRIEWLSTAVLGA